MCVFVTAFVPPQMSTSSLKFQHNGATPKTVDAIVLNNSGLITSKLRNMKELGTKAAVEVLLALGMTIWTKNERNTL